MAENARTLQFPVQSNTAPCSLMLYTIFVSFPNHLNAATFTLRSSLLHFIQIRHNINFFNQSTTLFTIPILLNFLQLKYQGNDHNTPFETHPKTMWVAVSTSILYYLAYDAMQLQIFPLRHFPTAAYYCLVWCGYASVASLASVLLPDSISLFVYLFFVLLSASELLYWLYRQLVMKEESGDFQIHGWRTNSQFLINIGRVMADLFGLRREILPR